jgi:hypothetical protein
MIIREDEREGESESGSRIERESEFILSQRTVNRNSLQRLQCSAHTECM